MYGKLIKTIVSALFIMPILVSCQNDGKTLSIGKPVFIHEFPRTVELKEIEDFNCDEVGVYAVKVVDTLLIINKSTTWAIYSLDGDKKYGEFLRAGNGPGEFTVFVPDMAKCHFFTENDSLFVYVPDTQKGYVWEYNISDILAGRSHTPQSVIKTDLIQGAIPTIVYGKDKMLVCQPSHNYRNIKRMLYEGDTLRQMPVTKEIDGIILGEQAEVNILSRGAFYNAAADKFVETMSFLNQMNIISEDGTEGKTICVGKRLDDISSLEDKDFFELRRSYLTASAWDEGFGAIYSGITGLEAQQHPSNNTQIQFFDWDGNPKCLVELPRDILSVDIDFASNIMYAIDRQNDKLIAYDATEIVQCLGE